FLATGAALAAAPFINSGRVRAFAGQRVVEYSTRAVDLVGSATVVDMLGPFKIGASTWLQKPETFTAADLKRFRDSGIDVFHIATGVGGVDAYTNVLRFLGLWNGFLAHHHDTLMRIDSVAALDAVNASGKVGVLLGIQNSQHFTRLDDVEFFHALGQRISQLTYNSRNMIGNGSTERRDEGLSDYGVAVVERMNKVGMAVDVSHCGDRTTLDAFEVSKRPVLITHSNCRALVPGHPRCKTDEAIRAMAKAGSVMGITGVRMFVKHDEPTTIEHMLDHYDHVRKLVGVEHLGLGSDIDLDGYDDLTPEENKAMRAGYKDSYGFREKIDIEGVDHPKRVFDLTEGLIRRGYTDADIRGVLGGNFRRVIAQIWM
ncbi:MAG: dipeptidase, partial [Vicinamibacterales bacterium]